VTLLAGRPYGLDPDLLVLTQTPQGLNLSSWLTNNVTGSRDDKGDGSAPIWNRIVADRAVGLRFYSVRYKL
jgi:hypothetical protein